MGIEYIFLCGTGPMGAQLGMTLTRALSFAPRVDIAGRNMRAVSYSSPLSMLVMDDSDWEICY